jgi:hypothetical protein
MIPHRTVLFADILGFAALVEAHSQLSPRFRRFSQLGGRYTSFRGAARAASLNALEIAFAGFHEAIAERVADARQHTDVSLMAFSDCAFIAVGNQTEALTIAQRLMVLLINRQIPIRIGVGTGTFQPVQFSSGWNSTKWGTNSAQFLGTGVVRAYQAERSGLKGLRVLIHAKTPRRSIHPYLSATGNSVAPYELCYLYGGWRGIEVERGDVASLNQLLALSLKAMHSTAHKFARHQYTQTTKALDCQLRHVGLPGSFSLVGL